MPQQRYASGRFTNAICDRCGWKYPLLDLQMEPLSAFGSPSNAPSGISVCPVCFDPPHPLSFLPLEVQRHGADPEQVHNPRPDVFPKAFPVRWKFPNSVYSNGPIIALQQGQTYSIYGAGVYGGYSATIAALSGVTINSVSLQSPRYVIVNLTISPSMPVGVYVLTVIDGNGNQSNGQIQVTA